MESNPSPPAPAPRHGTLPALVLALLLACCYWAYLPGTSGDFQFDDYSNLDPLRTLHGGATPSEYVQFILKGIASPLGRPISMATFAAQAQSWPGDAASFIHVNILLHLLNGLLLFWWLRRLATLTGTAASRGTWLALGATALWLLAPLQASTVLYVVQRMTELSATFVFLGMGLYLVGREALERGATRRALAWMSLGLAVGAGLGTLAKENAAQMPLMVLALEFTLLARLARPRAWRLWAVPFLALPSIAMLGYLAWVAATAHGYGSRDFTLPERLLTEPRVLFMYLHKIVTPWPSAVRLWYDDFPASRSLLEPWTTSVALLALGAAAAAAWRWRRVAPLPAFATLWFLACHVLESSALPLELVFEHRNYQASVGLWFALAAGALHLIPRASSLLAQRVFTALVGLYVLLQAFVTWEIATLWGKPLELSAWMAQRVPDSRRAALSFAGVLLTHQMPYQAVLQAQRGAQRWPHDPSFQLVTMTLSCQVAEFPFPEREDLLRRLRAVNDLRAVNGIVNYTDNVLSLIEGGHCPVRMPYPFSEVTGALMDSPGMRKQRQNVLLMHSRALKVEQRGAEARAVFAQAIDVKPQMILLIQAILDAVEAGDLPLARQHLERARTDPRIRERDRWSHRDDLPLLEQLIRSREAAAGGPAAR